MFYNIIYCDFIGIGCISFSFLLWHIAWHWFAFCVYDDCYYYLCAEFLSEWAKINEQNGTDARSLSFSPPVFLRSPSLQNHICSARATVHGQPAPILLLSTLWIFWYLTTFNNLNIANAHRLHSFKRLKW